MKTLTKLGAFLASIFLFGWLIFGVKGIPGAYALGFLIGFAVAVGAGVYLAGKRGER